MTNPQTIISQIEAHLSEIKRLLSPEEAKAFENLYYSISDRLAEEADPQRSTSKLEELLARYPAVEEILQESNTNPVSTPSSPIIPPSLRPTNPETPSELSGILEVGDQPSVKLRRTDLEPEKGAIAMRDQPSKESATIESKWTPEVLLQFLKEGVTTILALLIVGYTVILANRTLVFAGDPEKITDAKDVLLLMMGVAGVVIGYYFGRVPAEARAVQAQQEAKEATIQSEQVSENAEEVAEQAQRTLTRLSAASRRGDLSGTLDKEVAEDMQQLESKVAELRRLTRRGR